VLTARSLGGRPVLAVRYSEGDSRERHRGLSHHTRTVLELLLKPVTVAAPPDAPEELRDAARARGHTVIDAPADLAGYGRSGLPARTMGRDLEEDGHFFGAALAAGGALAALSEPLS
jgi:hypothetical protein